MDNTIMDDMVFQHNNQNSIYVLNSGYTSYGEFPHLKLIDSINTSNTHDRESNCLHSQPSSGGKAANDRVCTTVSRTLQRKLKSLGNNFNNVATEAIGFPTASSTSSVKCLPATAAIQKLFSCSSGIASSNNASSNNNNHSFNNNNNNNNNNYIRSREGRDCLSMTEKLNGNVDASAATLLGNHTNNSNNTNCNISSNGSTSTYDYSRSSNSNSSIVSSIENKKKYAYSKSNLIAKKTKFWKLLEEEKFRTNNNAANEYLTANNFDATEDSNSHRISSAAAFTFRDNSCIQKSTTTDQSYAAPEESLHSNDNNKNYFTNNKTAAAITAITYSEEPQQQYKSKNWSESDDSNNQHKEQQKSSYELYKEAAELFGLSCTLCDNCRCLDCQSGYFDCDDSDSCSDFSLMDEYDDDDVDVETAIYGMQLIKQQAMSNNNNNYDDRMATFYCNQHEILQQQQEVVEEQQEHDCCDAACRMTESNEIAKDYVSIPLQVEGSNENVSVNINGNVLADEVRNCIQNDMSHKQYEHHLMKMPILCKAGQYSNRNNNSSSTDITATIKTTAEGLNTQGCEQICLCECTCEEQQQQQQGNELENCASFNELSLLDAKVVQEQSTEPNSATKTQQDIERQRTECGQ